MLSFLRRLLGMADRGGRAADAIGDEMEGLLGDVRQFRAAVRQYLGIDEQAPALLPAPVEDVPATRRNGRAKAEAVS